MLSNDDLGFCGVKHNMACKMLQKGRIYALTILISSFYYKFYPTLKLFFKKIFPLIFILLDLRKGQVLWLFLKINLTNFISLVCLSNIFFVKYYPFFSCTWYYYWSIIIIDKESHVFELKFFLTSFCNLSWPFNLLVIYPF